MQLLDLMRAQLFAQQTHRDDVAAEVMRSPRCRDHVNNRGTLRIQVCVPPGVTQQESDMEGGQSRKTNSRLFGEYETHNTEDIIDHATAFHLT